MNQFGNLLNILLNCYYNASVDCGSWFTDIIAGLI